MQRGSSVLLLVLAVLLGGAAPALAAEPPLRSLGPAEAPNQDGELVWYERAPGLLRVLDDRAGTVRDVGIAGCTATFVEPPEALLRCDEGDPAVVDLATGARTTFPVAPVPDRYRATSGFVRGADDFSSAGRVWLGGSFPDLSGGERGKPCCISVFLHRRTGERRIDDEPGLHDLDSEALTRIPYPEPPCPTFRFGRVSRALFLDDCRGSRRLLSRCRPTCDSPIGVAGRVALVEGRRLVVLELRSGRRRTWRLPRSVLDTPSERVLLTRRRVVVAVPADARSGSRLLQVRFA